MDMDHGFDDDDVPWVIMGDVEIVVIVRIFWNECDTTVRSEEENGAEKFVRLFGAESVLQIERNPRAWPQQHRLQLCASVLTIQCTTDGSVQSNVEEI